jgi:carboxypeptidase family protein
LLTRPLLALLCLAALTGCRRSPEVAARLDAGAPASAPHDGLCYQQSDGCVECVTPGRPPPPLIEAAQSRPTVCDPKEPESCVEFCTVLAPGCALPWLEGKCVFDSEAAFIRAWYQRESADRPEMIFSGRVVDQAGHRVEGALVQVWISWRSRLTDVVDEVSGRDGGFRARLRGGPWKYVLRISHPGMASEIADRVLPERPDRTWQAGPPRLFRLVPEHFVRGRVTDSTTGAPVAGALAQALHTADDPIATSETRAGEDGTFSLGGLEPRRYLLRISKFGWRVTLKNPINAPAARVSVKLDRATVIKGVVRDADGEAARDVIVAAVLSAGPGTPGILYTLASDSEGRFAWELGAGTYYFWARRGEMMVYPPVKIELARGHEAEVALALNHRAARISGQVRAGDNYRLGAEGRVVLLSHSPLAFPRPAVGEIGRDGSFLITGVLPGRYELSVRDGVRVLGVVQGPRDVEAPIEPGSAVALREPVVVRRQMAGE